MAEKSESLDVLNFIKNIYHKRIAASDIEYGVAPDGSPSSLFFERGNSSSKSKYYKKTSTWEHEQEFRFVVSLGGRFVINLGIDIIKNVYLGCNMKNEKVIEKDKHQLILSTSSSKDESKEEHINKAPINRRASKIVRSQKH